MYSYFVITSHVFYIRYNLNFTITIYYGIPNIFMVTQIRGLSVSMVRPLAALAKGPGLQVPVAQAHLDIYFSGL